jgi:hypothetical protein
VYFSFNGGASWTQPADTAALRGPKRHAKTDKTDARRPIQVGRISRAMRPSSCDRL